MDLSDRVAVVRSTLTPEEEEYPSYRVMILVFYLGILLHPQVLY